MTLYRVRNLLRNFYMGAVTGVFIFGVGCVFLTIIIEWLVPKFDITTWASLGFGGFLGWLACQRHCESSVQVRRMITESFYSDFSLYLGTLSAGGLVAAYFASSLQSAGYVAYGVGEVFFLVYVLRLFVVVRYRSVPKSVG